MCHDCPLGVPDRSSGYLGDAAEGISEDQISGQSFRPLYIQQLPELQLCAHSNYGVIKYHSDGDLA